MAEVKTQNFGVYTNDRGKSRPRLDPENEAKESLSRMTVAVNVVAYMKSGFRKMGIRNVKTTLVGAVAAHMADYESDIDFSVECTEPTVDNIVQIIGAVDELYPPIQKTTKYKLDFHLQEGDAYEEAIKKTGLRTRKLFQGFFEEDM